VQILSNHDIASQNQDVVVLVVLDVDVAEL